MRPFLVKPARRISGKLALLGDKSIAHRCIILSSLSKGQTTVENFPFNKDCLNTIEAFTKLGVKISFGKKMPSGGFRITVFGNGLYGLSRQKSPISAGESGTTLRLLLGVLAGQSFKTKLIADKSLSRRPMLRVTAPLRMMGAKIAAKRKTQDKKIEEYPPIEIEGGNLNPVTYKMPVASAQVKSAVLLAGLFAKGKTVVIEPVRTRDHTERLLSLFKADIKVRGRRVSIGGSRELISPGKIYVPGDISSAGFFIVLAAIFPDSQLVIRNVSLNPSRIGVVRVLKRMGVKIQVTNHKSQVTRFEPMGDLTVKGSRLKGAKIGKKEIPSLIDELPILMVAACNAEGESVFEGIGELRVKETDRINSMTFNLKRMGADIEAVKKAGLENVIIRGGGRLKGARVRSFNDHRTAMSMIVAGLNATGQTTIDDISCIDKSFPNFLGILKSVIR